MHKNLKGYSKASPLDLPSGRYILHGLYREKVFASYFIIGANREVPSFDSSYHIPNACMEERKTNEVDESAIPDERSGDDNLPIM